MNSQDYITKMLSDDYYTTIDYEKDKNKTLTEVGLDSLDQVELSHFVSEKFDFKKTLPDNLSLCGIVEFIDKCRNEANNVIK